MEAAGPPPFSLTTTLLLRDMTSGVRRVRLNLAAQEYAHGRGREGLFIILYSYRTKNLGYAAGLRAAAVCPRLYLIAPDLLPLHLCAR